MTGTPTRPLCPATRAGVRAFFALLAAIDRARDEEGETDHAAIAALGARALLAPASIEHRHGFALALVEYLAIVLEDAQPDPAALAAWLEQQCA
jgi:hypothetical protein